MKNIYLLLTLFFITDKVLSQSPKDMISIPSPNAMTLGEYASQSVALSAGRPNISIPLYTLKEGSFSLPISLTYNAIGFRPDVHPGWVGMDWSLNAGGVITRVVKGIPDETAWTNYIQLSTNQSTQQSEAKGYGYNMAQLDIEDWSSLHNVKQLAKAGDWVETEPDEFVFNFNGYSGKFLFNEKGEIKVVSDPAIKVESEVGIIQNNYFLSKYFQNFSNVEAGNDVWHYILWGFRITTPDGYQYEFGLFGREYTGENFAIETSINFFQELDLMRSWDSWYLSRIINPEGIEIIKFTYENDAPIASFGKTIAMDKQEGSAEAGGIFKLFGPVSASSRSIIERYDGRLIAPVYLSKIETKNIRIDFARSATKELKYNYEDIGWDLIRQSVTSYSDAVHGLPARYPIAARPSELGAPDVLLFEREDIKLFNAVGQLQGSVNVQNLYLSLLGKNTGLESDGFYVYEAVNFNKLKWQKLDKISIVDKTFGEPVVKSFNLRYTDSKWQRLMLLSLQEVGSDNKALPYYLFEYEDVNSDIYPGGSKGLVPAYNSYSVDHWGFFNGTNPNVGLDYNNRNTLIAYKDKRNTNLEYIYSNILNKITYPTGGTTEFSYEPHEFDAVVERDKTRGYVGIKSLPTPESCGGLRIKKIVDNAHSDSPPIVKTYEYKDGILGGEIQYYWEGYKGTFIESDNIYTHDRFVTQTLLPVSSNSAGGHISYSTVTETTTNGGFIEYEFSNHLLNGDEDFISSIDPEKSPYSPVTSLETERGRIKSKRIYDKDGRLVRQELYEYEYLPMRQSQFIRAVATKQFPVLGGYGAEGTAYKVITCPYNLKRTLVTTFDTNKNLSMTSTTTYGYNEYNLSSSISEDAGNGIVVGQRITYANDFDYIGPAPLDPVTKAMSSMVSKNLLKYPIEILKLRNNKIVSATVQTYVEPMHINKVYELNTYKPLSPLEYREPKYGSYFTYGEHVPFIVDPQFRLKVIYDQYDRHGNVLEYHNDKGVHTSFIYGYNNSLPVAVVDNATYNQVTEILGASVVDAVNNTSLLDGMLRQKLQPLYTDARLSNARVTLYTYNVLGKMTSTTDINGRITYYEYDGLGRLKHVRDHDHNILKNYAYNLK